MMMGSDIRKIEDHWRGLNRVGNRSELDQALIHIDTLMAEIRRLRFCIAQNATITFSVDGPEFDGVTQTMIGRLSEYK